ncbi:MAG TPA: GHMP kinase [Candidatus Angelobacter sp.]|nr:GHMP kinase [Candidatus Angelobacter sp.]
MPPPGTIVAHAPCRVDLAGGTLDLWPLYLFHPGAVTVNFAVNILTRCKVTRLTDDKIRLKSIDTKVEEEFRNFGELCSARKFKHPLAAHLVRFFAPDGGFEVETHSESPAGAGISGSSALMIATTAALARYTGRKLDREQIRVIAQNVEAQLIKVPTGCQDYYPALYGGVSAIHLDPDGIHHAAVRVAPEELDRRFVLVYTGAPRKSGINNWEVFKAHINGDKKIFHNFERIGEIARAMHHALSMADWKQVAKLIREEWKLRKTNAPKITTPMIEKLIAVALRQGALAAKVCGAGGGGCVVFLTEPENREHISAAIRSYGGQVLPAMVARDGLTVSGRSLGAE